MKSLGYPPFYTFPLRPNLKLKQMNSTYTMYTHFTNLMNETVVLTVQ